ncbi:MAG: GIY-YIG nuclease family protein [Desulfobacterales bacterium]|jgi:putative endonuclease
MDKRQWVVYLIRCSDESLYCGITNNLKNRLAAHNSGRGAKYTRSRRPVKLVAASSEMTKSDALRLEYRVKQVPASKKYLELTKEENKMTKKLKKDLQAVNREIKALSKKVDKMIVAVGKIEKSKAVKAKPVKKTVAKAKPVKKVAAKKAPVKKVAVKKPATKKPVKLTAADTVFGFIKRYRKGVDVSTLMEKTGFNKRKIYDNVKVLKKRGKIKNAGIGIYVKA